MKANSGNRSHNTLFDNVRLRVNRFRTIYRLKKGNLTGILRAFQVEKNDSNAMAVVDIRFANISDFTLFSELCARTVIRLGISLRLPHETDANVNELSDAHSVGNQPSNRPKVPTSHRNSSSRKKRERTGIHSNVSKMYVCASSTLLIY